MTETKAIEAVLMARSSRSNRSCSPSSPETPVGGSSAVRELHDEYEREGRGFTLVKIAGGYRYRRTPTWRLHRAVRARRSSARLSGPRSRPWRSSPTSSRSPGAALGDPRCERRVDDRDADPAVRRRDRSRPGPDRRSSTAPPVDSRAGGSRLAAGAAPLAGFVPNPRWWRRSRRSALRVDDASAAAGRRRRPTPPDVPSVRRHRRHRAPSPRERTRTA
jgi:hypothetical protein